jgi:hypothetical protein
MFVHPYFSTVWTVLACPRYSFGLTKISSDGNLRLVLALLRSSFGLAESSLLKWLLLYQRKYRIALSLPLGQPRLILARPRNSSPHVKDLFINPLGPTMIFSQVNMCICMVRPRMWWKLLARFISPSLTFSHLHILPVQLHFTSSRLVLRVVYWRASLPYFRYNSVLLVLD